MAAQERQVALTAVEKRKAETLATVGQLLDKYKGEISRALPRHMTPERMIRVALTTISTTPALQECTPLSICGCIVQASILGLEPSSLLGEAYLVPFKNKNTGNKECQLMIGYMGLLKLVRNSGELKMVATEFVFEKDEFSYRKGLDPQLNHIEARGERGERIGVWAAILTKDGGKYFEFMTMDQIEEHRDKFSKSAYDKDGNLTGIWRDNPEWMYKKTVLRKVCKLAPKSVQAQIAVSLDERAEAGVQQQFSLDVPIELQSIQVNTGQLEAPSDMPQRKSDTKVIDAELVDNAADREAAEKAAMIKNINLHVQRLKWRDETLDAFLSNHCGFVMADIESQSLDSLIKAEDDLARSKANGKH